VLDCDHECDLNIALLLINCECSRQYWVFQMSQSAKREEYLTSRVLARATSKGLKEASDNAREISESLVVAEEGWIVRIHRDGSKEKIKKISKVDTSKLVLK